MNDSALISVNRLRTLLSNPKLILLDATIDKVNQPIDPHHVELIPNSLFLDIEGVFSDHTSSLPHTMISAVEFEKEARKLGIDSDSIVVIYDRWGIYSSPRAWWMFRYMGHEQTYVLQGGLVAWKSQNLPLVPRHITSDKYGNFAAYPNPEWLTTKAQILKELSFDDTTITDARSSARYTGVVPEPRAGLRSGHIPGSSNLPFDLVLDDIRYRNKVELIPILSKHLKKDKKNIFTCGSGITASILALAAYENGYRDISVYDGSWSEWGSDPDVPVSR